MKAGRTLLVLVAGLLSGLALVAGAAGTTSTPSTRVRHLEQPVAALAMDGSRVAYDLTARDDAHATNKLLVWNVRTGKTTRVSGKKTAVADSSGTGSGVFQIALAGSRVAWLMNEGGNLEGDDYLLTSSLAKPKERQVASVTRSGDNCPGRQTTGCAGQWLGGLVGSGNLVALNRWGSDSQGAAASGGLYALEGTKLKSIASGLGTLLAVAADGGRVAVLHSDGSVSVYSAAGNVLTTVNPPSAKAAALSGKNLVVLTRTRTLELYDARTGAHLKTLSVHGKKGPGNLDVQGSIATYTSGWSVRAVNLSSGKDRAVANFRNHHTVSRIAFAQVSSSGLAYAAGGLRASFGKGTLVFLPLARVKAAVH